MTVSNSTDYTIGGPGQIGGGVALIKNGPGALTLTSANNHGGGLVVNSGTVRIGHEGALGTGRATLNGGGLSADGLVARTITNQLAITNAATLGDSVNNGFLNIAGPVDFAGAARNITTLSDASLGGGSTNGRLNKLGPATLTLRGVHIWNGDAEVREGVVAVDGACVTNNGAFRADCTLPDGTARLVITNGAIYTLINANGNLRLGLDGDTSATNIAEIAGMVRFPNAVFPNGRIYLSGGGTRAVANLRRGGDAEVYAVEKDGAAGYAEFNFYGGVLKPLTNNGAFFQGLDAAYVRDADAIIDTAGFDITIGQSLRAGGAGGLRKDGLGALTLAGSNTFSGSVTISNGTLKLAGTGSIAMATNIFVPSGGAFDVTAVTGFAVVPGQTLSGSGFVYGDVTVNGTVSPAGVFTFANRLGLAGNTVMAITKTGTNLTSSRIAAITLALGGTLTVATSGDPLAAGDVIDLFNAATTTGSFLDLNLPALPPGLAWDGSQLPTDGTLRVVTSAIPLQLGGIFAAGGNIVVNVTGGTPGGNYYILTSTNVAAPIGQWLPVATNVFNAGGQSVFTNLIEPGTLNRYFRIQAR
jgi:autotransporter-associated beta strand protein